MDYLRRRCEGDWDGLLQPLYGIDGREDISETELDHLSGYMNSRPVRLGNAAFGQVQLDLYGASWMRRTSTTSTEPLDHDLWQNLRRILGWLSDNWQRPDEGSGRSEAGKRQFVSSKVMCWVALERAGRISRQRGPSAGDAGSPSGQIYEEIIEKGWNPAKASSSTTALTPRRLAPPHAPHEVRRADRPALALDPRQHPGRG